MFCAWRADRESRARVDRAVIHSAASLRTSSMAPDALLMLRIDDQPGGSWMPCTPPGVHTILPIQFIVGTLTCPIIQDAQAGDEITPEHKVSGE